MISLALVPSRVRGCRSGNICFFGMGDDSVSVEVCLSDRTSQAVFRGTVAKQGALRDTRKEQNVDKAVLFSLMSTRTIEISEAKIIRQTLN